MRLLTTVLAAALSTTLSAQFPLHTANQALGTPVTASSFTNTDFYTSTVLDVNSNPIVDEVYGHSIASNQGAIFKAAAGRSLRPNGSPLPNGIIERDTGTGLGSTLLVEEIEGNTYRYAGFTIGAEWVRLNIDFNGPANVLYIWQCALVWQQGWPFVYVFSPWQGKWGQVADPGAIANSLIFADSQSSPTTSTTNASSWHDGSTLYGFSGFADVGTIGTQLADAPTVQNVPNATFVSPGGTAHSHVWQVDQNGQDFQIFGANCNTWTRLQTSSPVATWDFDDYIAVGTEGDTMHFYSSFTGTVVSRTFAPGQVGRFLSGASMNVQGEYYTDDTHVSVWDYSTGEVFIFRAKLGALETVTGMAAPNGPSSPARRIDDDMIVFDNEGAGVRRAIRDGGGSVQQIEFIMFGGANPGAPLTITLPPGAVIFDDPITIQQFTQAQFGFDRPDGQDDDDQVHAYLYQLNTGELILGGYSWMSNTRDEVMIPAGYFLDTQGPGLDAEDFTALAVFNNGTDARAYAFNSRKGKWVVQTGLSLNAFYDCDDGMVYAQDGNTVYMAGVDSEAWVSMPSKFIAGGVVAFEFKDDYYLEITDDTVGGGSNIAYYSRFTDSTSMITIPDRIGASTTLEDMEQAFVINSPTRTYTITAFGDIVSQQDLPLDNQNTRAITGGEGLNIWFMGPANAALVLGVGINRLTPALSLPGIGGQVQIVPALTIPLGSLNAKGTLNARFPLPPSSGTFGTLYLQNITADLNGVQMGNSFYALPLF